MRAAWTLDRLIRLINNHTRKGFCYELQYQGIGPCVFDPFIRLENRTPFILSFCFIWNYIIISANASARYCLHTID